MGDGWAVMQSCDRSGSVFDYWMEHINPRLSVGSCVNWLEADPAATSGVLFNKDGETFYLYHHGELTPFTDEAEVRAAYALVKHT